ncbi:hypothetical protein IJT93_00265 [bacterium]|nr:hypothetical protein [bacterium]
MKKNAPEALLFLLFFLVGFMPFINFLALVFLIKELKIKGRDIKFGAAGLRDFYKTAVKGLLAGMIFSVLGIIFAIPGYIYDKLTDRKNG